MLQELILHLSSTKSLKHDNINKLCLWIIEEHICFILTPDPVSKLRHGTHAQQYTLFT